MVCSRFFFTPTNQKKNHFCFNDIDFSLMPRFTENQRHHAIGILQAGLTQNIVARHFGVHRNTIQSFTLCVSMRIYRI